LWKNSQKSESDKYCRSYCYSTLSETPADGLKLNDVAMHASRFWEPIGDHGPPSAGAFTHWRHFATLFCRLACQMSCRRTINSLPITVIAVYWLLLRHQWLADDSEI